MDVKKIALFGGTFDPPHIGHRKIIEFCKISFDKIIIVPNKYSPCQTKNNPIASPSQRLDMLKVMFPNQSIIVDDFEIRSKKDSYTYYTLKYLIEKYNNSQITMIIGEDQLTNLHNWFKSDWLIKNISMLCFSRKGYSINYENEIDYIEFDCEISSRDIREKYYSNQDVSSYLDKHVLEYINREGIYSISK